MAKNRMSTVTLVDGRTFNIDPGSPRPGDLIALERQFAISSDAMGGPDSRTEWSMYVIWRMCRRSDPSLESFDEFIEAVVEIVNDSAADAVDPTPAEVSTE